MYLAALNSFRRNMLYLFMTVLLFFLIPPLSPTPTTAHPYILTRQDTVIRKTFQSNEEQFCGVLHTLQATEMHDFSTKIFKSRTHASVSFRRYIQYIKCSIVTYKCCSTDKIYATQSLKRIYYPVCLALHCNFFLKSQIPKA